MSKQSLHHVFVERHGIPNGWDEKRLRELARLVGGGTPDSSDPRFWDGGIPWLTPTEMTGIKGRYATTSARTITQAAIDSSACQLLPVGSLVVSTRGTIGNVVIAGVPLTCNQSCEALLPREDVTSDYLYYLLTYARPILMRFGAGTTFASVTRRDIRDIRFTVPKNGEQTTISSLLAHADDALTAAEEKLKTARRLKTALIQQLFTRGLPGRHTRFQQTKWFTAPESWKPRRLREIAKVEAGFTMGRDLTRYETVEVAYLTVVNVLEGRFNLDEIEKVEVKITELDDLLLRPRDILMTEGGDRDKLGRGGIWQGEVSPCVYQNHIFRVRFTEKTYQPELFHFLIQSWQARNYFQAHAKQTSNLCTINSRELKAFPFFEPDEHEQAEMLSILTASDKTIGAVEAELFALEKLKGSLLQNLITGRVRVSIDP